MNAWRPIASIGLLASMALWAACTALEGTVAPNQPPETTLWVTGDVDTVRHTQRFFWDGQDTDGVVTAFEFRWLYEPGAEPVGYDSTVWFRTERSDSLFTVFTPDGANAPTFEVRAIDDQGARDPSPASQSFRFLNEAPQLLITGVPSDTTYPVATIDWIANDPDGNINNASYRVWLEGKEDDAQITTETQFTLLPDLFKDGGGAFVPGPYKVFVTALDDGGRASLPDSFSWYVELPVGTVLLVDDLPSSVAGSFFYDLFYLNEFDSRIGAGSYTLLDVENTKRFRSEQDVRETFLFFDDVFWYTEINRQISPELALIELGLRDHLDAGGDFYITASVLLGDGGALDDTFFDEVIGGDRFHIKEVPGFDPTTNFSLQSSGLIHGRSPLRQPSRSRNFWRCGSFHSEESF